MERRRAGLFGKVSASPREGWSVRFPKVRSSKTVQVNKFLLLLWEQFNENPAADLRIFPPDR